ncbi:oligosaccharide flippase family protein [Deinococcus planocerae]|uniref:oligosaccharide flippase family protein n=1 Tax=Deinococcus planocerae TaxID=1737569 RepID=UPI0015E0CFD2|nr:oligosaccharide flippase family protein [Deinococcus planocerae]
MRANPRSADVARNAGALYIVQIANYVIPLFLLPFLANTLGVAGYGRLATLQTIATYGLVLTDYGFQLSATRKVAAMLEQGQEVQDVYVNVMSSRIVLALLATVGMCLAVSFIPYLKLTPSVALALGILVLGNALTPLWLFQGYQRMTLVSVVVLSARLSAAALTLALVRSAQDVGVALWAQTLGTALPVGLALWRAGQLTPRRGARPSLAGMRAELLDGWHIFQTAIFSTLLTNSGILVLGATAGAQVAGGYAAVERVGKGVASMLTPVTQAIYPRVSASFTASYQEGLSVLRRFGLPLLTLSVVLAVLMIVMTEVGGVEWLFGADYRRFANVLVVLSPWVVFGVLNNLLGIQYLTNVGEASWYATAFTISSLFAFAMFLVLSHRLSFWGVACGLVIGELTLAALLGWRVCSHWKQKRQIGVSGIL